MDLHLENDRIIFTARFSGHSVQILIIPAAILAIYAKENGRGMEFGEDPDELPPSPSTVGTDVKGRKPALTLVKKD